MFYLLTPNPPLLAAGLGSFLQSQDRAVHTFCLVLIT